MAQVTLGGNAVNTIGDLPAVGSTAPEFKLTKTDLSDVSLSEFSGEKLILNIFPSVDTAVCAASVHRFNKEASGFDDVTVLCISADLPFALKRFCGAEGLEDVVALSTMRGGTFGKDYGVRLIDGPLEGVLARSIVVLDAAGKVIYTQLVPEIKEEPDYDSALAAVR